MHETGRLARQQADFFLGSVLTFVNIDIPNGRFHINAARIVRPATDRPANLQPNPRYPTRLLLKEGAATVTRDLGLAKLSLRSIAVQLSEVTSARWPIASFQRTYARPGSLGANLISFCYLLPKVTQVHTMLTLVALWKAAGIETRIAYLARRPDI